MTTFLQQRIERAAAWIRRAAEGEDQETAKIVRATERRKGWTKTRTKTIGFRNGLIRQALREGIPAAEVAGWADMTEAKVRRLVQESIEPDPTTK